MIAYIDVARRLACLQEYACRHLQVLAGGQHSASFLNRRARSSSIFRSTQLA